MKKVGSLYLAAITLFFLISCGTGASQQKENKEEDKENKKTLLKSFIK